jgi:hypothetical protein
MVFSFSVRIENTKILKKVQRYKGKKGRRGEGEKGRLGEYKGK